MIKIKDTLWLDIPGIQTSIRVDRIVCVYFETNMNISKEDKPKVYIFTQDMFDDDYGYGCQFDSMDEAQQFKDSVLEKVAICLYELNDIPIRVFNKVTS